MKLHIFFGLFIVAMPACSSSSGDDVSTSNDEVPNSAPERDLVQADARVRVSLAYDRLIGRWESECLPVSAVRSRKDGGSKNYPMLATRELRFEGDAKSAKIKVTMITIFFEIGSECRDKLISQTNTYTLGVLSPIGNHILLETAIDGRKTSMEVLSSKGREIAAELSPTNSQSGAQYQQRGTLPALGRFDLYPHSICFPTTKKCPNLFFSKDVEDDNLRTQFLFSDIADTEIALAKTGSYADAFGTYTRIADSRTP